MVICLKGKGCIYHCVVPPCPMGFSATMGPPFLREEQDPNAPCILSSLQTNMSILAAEANLNSSFESFSNIFLNVSLKGSELNSSLTTMYPPVFSAIDFISYKPN